VVVIRVWYSTAPFNLRDSPPWSGERYRPNVCGGYSYVPVRSRDKGAVVLLGAR
jgi:hypothetical protein